MGFLGAPGGCMLCRPALDAGRQTSLTRGCSRMPSDEEVTSCAKYRDYQRRAGAVVADERNWTGEFCRRCLERQAPPCTAAIECLVCKGAHYVRNCEDDDAATVERTQAQLEVLKPRRSYVPPQESSRCREGEAGLSKTVRRQRRAECPRMYTM